MESQPQNPEFRNNPENLELESQPQNPEFRNNPEKFRFHPYIKG